MGGKRDNGEESHVACGKRKRRCGTRPPTEPTCPSTPQIAPFRTPPESPSGAASSGISVCCRVPPVAAMTVPKKFEGTSSRKTLTVVGLPPSRGLFPSAVRGPPQRALRAKTSLTCASGHGTPRPECAAAKAAADLGKIPRYRRRHIWKRQQQVCRPRNRVIHSWRSR